MDSLTKPGTGTPIELEKIRTYLQTLNLTTNLTPAEEKQFIEIAQAFGLNPFKREIYASKYGTSFSIIVGFETYIKRAERSGRLSGWNVRTEGDINYSDIAKSRIKAIITIYRKDWGHPFVHEVWFEEYAQKTKDGYLNKFWREKPLTMIKKVAMAQGFRLCFSDELGGLPYTSEEIGVFTDSLDVTTTFTPASNSTPSPAIPSAVTPEPKPEKPKKEKKKVEKIEKDDDSFTPAEPTEPTDLTKEFERISSEIDKAETIEDLKRIYQENVGWSKDGEFLGRLSVKRKEIEYKEEELRRRKLEEPPLEVKIELESRPANKDGELF
jgi:phage recombination protein Bet